MSGRGGVMVAIAIWLLLAPVLADGALAQRSSTRRLASTRAMTIRAEMAGVLLQSKRYDEAAREFAVLLAFDPNNRAYRLGLARSLAWGERSREAEQQLIILLRDRPGDATVESLLHSVRADLAPGSREAAQWLAERPGSPTYRRILARALTREGRTDDALAHYDTLLRARPAADLFVERAYVHVAGRDFAAAERDVHSSIAVNATLEAYVLLGDVHRWRGDLGAARNWYVRARVLSPDAPEVAAGWARLARDERPAIAYIPEVTEPDGWESTNTTASDNLGVNLTTLTLRRGLRQRLGFDVSGGVKALRLTDTDPTRGGGEEGFGADLAISRETTRKQFYARARLRGGFVFHPSTKLAHEGAFSLAAFAGAWGVGAEIAASPAYPSLLTFASTRPLLSGGAQLREQSSAISVAGPLGAVDVAARHQSASLSDGNTRSGLQGYARFPARRPLALLYSGSSLSYDRSSPSYWSPERYVAHSGGAEYALRRVRGLSFAARVLPGVAWTTESDSTGARVDRSAMQLSGGVEASYRSPRWEIGGGLSYGRGRAGEYERFDAMLRARVLP
jgi:tetratricopeptide (TPR) repeat protein